MLLEQLKKNPNFQALSPEKQEIMARLASVFDDNELALYLSPQELTDKLNIGNRTLWQEFLNMEIVRRHINTQMAFQAQVASRKTFQSLVTEGRQGNVQAVKQINELSGILNSGDRNKVIVLHQIQRPKIKPVSNETH